MLCYKVQSSKVRILTDQSNGTVDDDMRSQVSLFEATTTDSL